MSTVHIILRDREDGLVDVETTVHDWENGSNAAGMASRLNGFMAEIAQELQPPAPRPATMCELGTLELVKA